MWIGVGCPPIGLGIERMGSTNCEWWLPQVLGPGTWPQLIPDHHPHTDANHPLNRRALQRLDDWIFWHHSRTGLHCNAFGCRACGPSESPSTKHAHSRALSAARRHHPHCCPSMMRPLIQFMRGAMCGCMRLVLQGILLTVGSQCKVDVPTLKFPVGLEICLVAASQGWI